MQISSNYSMNGVPYENRRRQKDIPQFSTERAKQENKSINPYMEDTDFNEKAFDMIGSNAPQDVKDAWMEAAKEVNANGLGIKKNGMLSHISQMMVQRLNKQMNGEGDVFRGDRVQRFQVFGVRVGSVAVERSELPQPIAVFLDRLRIAFL